MQTKVCKKCKTEKPVSEFHFDKKQKDGYTRYCKDCRRVEAKNYYQFVKYHKNIEYHVKNMFFPLAVIGYIELAKQHGTVTAELVNSLVKATPINTKKAIEVIRGYLND